jgi:hypothetical protein
MLSTSRNRKHTPMNQTETIEIYAFLHSLKNGILTISPNQGVFGQVELPVHEVTFIAVDDLPRMVALKIPAWLANGKGLRTYSEEVKTQSDPIIDSVNKAVNDYVDELNRSSQSWPTTAEPTIKLVPDSDTEGNHLAGYFQGYEIKESN